LDWVCGEAGEAVREAALDVAGDEGSALLCGAPGEAVGDLLTPARKPAVAETGVISMFRAMV